MKNKHARIINGVASCYLILGLLFGILVGGLAVFLGGDFSALESQVTLNEGSSIFFQES